MKKLDPTNRTPEQEEALERWLYELLDQMFKRDHFDYNMFRLNCALKQKTIHQAYVDGDLQSAGITKSYIEKIDGINLDANYSPDEFSNLKTPILLKVMGALITHVNNIVFPLNGDQVGVDRKYDEFFDQNSINDFLPIADGCWQSILETENRNYQFQSVYESALKEGLAHGVWALDHEYDDQADVVEPLAPGVQNIGLYPLRSDWRKSNRCFYVDLNYNQLLERSDLDQTVIEKIKPRITPDTSDTDRNTRSAHQNPNTLPFGKVRLVKFYCPSVYIEADGEVLYGEGLFVIALINPSWAEGADGESGKKLYILKISTDVPLDRHGLLLGTPVVNQPNEFFNLGLFYPWLDHQLSANGFYSAGIRLASYLSRGPFNEEKTGYSGINRTEEDLSKGFYPFQVISGRKFTPVFAPEFIEFIQVGYNTIAKLENDVQAGIGVDKGSLASVNDGRNTKDEVLRAGGAGDLKIVEYAVRFNNQVYVPSLFTRIRSQQQILKEQVGGKIQEVKDLLQAEASGLQSPPDEMLMEMILEENKLFKRLINSSGLRSKYREFYKKRQKQLIENQIIAQELQNQEQETMSLYQFSLSPVVPEMMPPPPVGEQVDPTTGTTITVTMTPKEEAEYRQAWIASEQQKRFEAKKEADMKVLTIRKKQLSIKDVDEIPELSNVLMFNMLTAPIESSDIRISGVVEAILKNVRDEDLLRVVQLVESLPDDTMRKVDFSKVFTLIMKGNSVTADMIMKDQAQLEREEEAMEQEAEFNREVSIEMAKNPGAQPPQIGAGNSQ